MSKLAIITGASAGIGMATARWCLSHDFDVISLARRPCPISEASSHKVDLALPLPDILIAKLRAKISQANQVAIVHCAGLHNGDTALSVTREAMTQSMAINVVAPAMINRTLLTDMPRGSSIVFIGSTLGDKAVPGAIGYIASKHGVNGLMRATCQDLAGTGIHTAVVSPGFTDTEMLRSHLGDDPAVMAGILETVTQGRLIEVDEIAATIGFCINNPVINGSVIHANLGQVER